MGIRRTREQKESTQIKLLKVQYSYRAPVVPDSTQATTSPAKNAAAKTGIPSSSRDLFAYDVKLIFNDLKKTAVITAGILILLVVITVYLKH